jgi:iduronate 2-sulfatase
VFTFANSFRDEGPGWTSMLGAFKKRGYTVAGQGKIYHPRSPPLDDSDLSWSSAFLPYPEWTQRGDPCPGDPPYDPFLERTQRPPQRRRRLDEAIVSDPGNGPACPVPRDHNITDAQIADLALENLAIVARAPNPFVLAVGLHKPHLPWTVPQAYYDMAPNSEDVALAQHTTPPVGMPELAFFSSSIDSELFGFSNVNITDALPPSLGGRSNPLPPELARQWRRGYYAAVRHTDEMVGRVLDGLATSGRADETVVVLHGDHGWQLGEHGIWAKQTCFELATRVPLIIHVPGAAGAPSRGQRTRSLVELVDMCVALRALHGIEFHCVLQKQVDDMMIIAS